MLDLDGLQVAYLGVALAHYLDLETGDILDVPLDAEPPGSGDRYLRIPTRTPESETEDREVFVAKMPPSPMRDELTRAIADWNAFREILSEDRKTERQFFNFKNDRATKAIEEWAASEGLS
jgi:hypothetical protein